MACMEVERKEENDNGDSQIKTIKNCYKETFRHIDEALKLEDKSKQEEAILCYKKSLRTILNGLDIVVDPADVAPPDFIQYETYKEKLSRAQQEVLHRLAALNVTDYLNMDSNTQSVSANMEVDTDSDIKRNGVINKEEAIRETEAGNRVVYPSAPPAYQEHAPARSVSSDVDKVWHDTKELINIKEGVRLFHVMGTEVSTWTSECTLQVFQIFKEKLEGISPPPAFLKCGEWLYPMEPGKSPVLKTAHRTYMFPDMAVDGRQVIDPLSLPCVGIVLADFVPEALVTRFERVLSLYSDFKKELPSIESEKPERPPPPVFKENGESPVTKRNRPHIATDRTQVDDVETIIAEPGIRDEPIGIVDRNRWSTAITKGIHIGSQWISWGFLKGSEYASTMVEKGSISLQKRIQPNPASATVSPEVSRNIRQLNQTTGSVVQISSFLAATLGSLIINLGKNLAPVVVHQGQKLLPEKLKGENSEKTQQVIDNAKKVAVAGLQGFSLVFVALEQSGKNLYKSVSKAAVEVSTHKYGEEVGEVTSDAMGAAGNTAQVIWNVRKLGPKAIAKRTAKETGKAMVDYDEKDNPLVRYHKDGLG